jgi:hypothetical protein
MALLVRSESGGRAAYGRLLAAARSGRLKRSTLEASHARYEQVVAGLQP